MLATVDFTAPADELARALVAACHEDGGVVVTGHGVTAVDELLTLAPWFFALPAEDREAIRVNAAGRGYAPPPAHGKPGFPPDRKEVFQAAAEQPSDLAGPAARFAGVNQWPPLDGFRDVVERALEQLDRFAFELLGLLATGLGHEPAAFGAGGEHPIVLVRLHHYPAGPGGGGFGAAPHTDFGALGLIAEWPAVGGFEACDRSGRWLPVIGPPGALIVIVGELLAWWSGGALRALPHRVPVPGGAARISVGAFVNPDPTAVLRPVTGDGEPVSTAEFIAALADRRETGRAVSVPAS